MLLQNGLSGIWLTCLGYSFDRSVQYLLARKLANRGKICWSRRNPSFQLLWWCSAPTILRAVKIYKTTYLVFIYWEQNRSLKKKFCIILAFPKRVTSWRGLSPRHCSRATQFRYGKNVATVRSRWQHCGQFNRPEAWTSNLPPPKRMRYHSTNWTVQTTSVCWAYTNYELLNINRFLHE